MTAFVTITPSAKTDALSDRKLPIGFASAQARGRSLVRSGVDAAPIPVGALSDQEPGAIGIAKSTDEYPLEPRLERLTVCVAIDVATRQVLAMRVSPKADIESAIATLAMAVDGRA